MNRVVITGATGFLGSHLVRLLLDRGCQVFAVIRPGSVERFRMKQKDICHCEHLHIIPASLEHILDIVPVIRQADAFLHFAWGGVNRDEIDDPSVQAANVEWSVNCIHAAYRLGCRVFMDAGSRVEYGAASSVMSEDITCHPVNEYGKAKLTFYQRALPLCRQYAMTYYHLRFFSVYGFGDHPWSVISTLIRELRENRTVSLSACRHLWNFMYIDDASEAVYHLYLRSLKVPVESFAVNIASQDTRPLKEFVEEVKTIIGGEGGLQYGTFVQAKEGALSIIPDISRLMELTEGFSISHTFAQGIRKTIEKEVEHKDEED